MQAVAQFLSARDILTHSHTCVRLRESISFAREISARFPGRTRAGARETPEIRAALPDWKFALMLEARGNRAFHLRVFDCGKCVSDDTIPATKEVELLMKCKHHMIDAGCEREMFSDVLRGDAIHYNGNTYYWNGIDISAKGPCDIPRDFNIPFEFSFDYFVTNRADFLTFIFDASKYRDQILSSLIAKKQGKHKSYSFRISENSREFRFVISQPGPYYCGEYVDLEVMNEITLQTISYVGSTLFLTMVSQSMKFF